MNVIRLKTSLRAPDAGQTGGGGDGKVSTGSPEAVFGATAATPAITAEPATTTGKPATDGGASNTTPPAAESTTPPTAPTPPPAGTSVTMTEDQLAQLAQRMVAGMPQPQAASPVQQADRPLTPEEQAQFDREFNVVRITPEVFQSIMGFAPENPQQLKAMETFAHGIVKMANAMTMYRVQQELQAREGQLRQRLDPVLQTHQAQHAKATEDAFFQKHADLKDFAPLVTEVALAEKARGTKFKSAAEAADFVANKARALLGKSAPNGGTTPSTTPRQPTKPSMPTTSVGGRSGSNSSPQPASGPKSVFGDLDGTR